MTLRRGRGAWRAMIKAGLPAGTSWFRRWWVISFLLALVAVLPGNRRGWKAGFATLDLSPPWPLPLAGYSARGQSPARESLGPLRVSALVLEDAGGRRAALVSCDLIGISEELWEAVLGEIPATLSLNRNNLLLCATHTHSGPGGLASSGLARLACGDFNPGAFRWTAARIVRALAQASGDLRPASLTLGSGSQAGLIRNRRRADGPVEEQLGLIEVARPGRRPLVIVQGAAHPTILPATSLRLSADFPGALARELDRRGLDCLYFSGALGDQAPRADRGLGDPERMRLYGQDLAGRVLDGLRLGGRALSPRLKARNLEVDFPPSVLGPWLPKSPGVLALALGDHLIYGVPGEPVADAGLVLRWRAQALGYRSCWPLGLANGHLGYFDVPSGFRINSYESLLTLQGPDSVDALAAAIPAPSGQSPHALPPDLRGASREKRGEAWFLKLSGSAEEMGYQHGFLMKKEIREFYAAFLGWLGQALRQAGDRPPLLQGLRLENLALPWLCLKARSFLPYSDPALMEEIRGLARGADLPFDGLLLMNVFLSLAEQPGAEDWLHEPPAATCTLLGLEPRRGGLLLARNLDWGLAGLLPRYSAVILQRPDHGFPFVSFGWLGLVGCLTAMNSQGLALAEESVASPRDSRLDGEPLMFLLRRLIEKASSLDEARTLLAGARGTCGYHISLADGKSGKTGVLEMSARHQAWRPSRSGIAPGVSLLRRAGDFEGGRLPEPELPGCDPSSLRRYAALDKWLQSRPGNLASEDLMELLRLRSGGLASPRTLQSVVLDPLRFRAWTAQGRLPASDGEFVRYDFSSETRGPELGAPARRELEKRLGPDKAWDRAALLPAARLTTSSQSPPFRSFRVQNLEMSSTLREGPSSNQKLLARIYEPRGPVLADVLFLPMWQGGENDAEDLISRGLAGRGFRVALMPQAYQWGRSPPGKRSGSLLIRPDSGLTRESIIQSLADAERLCAWLSSTTRAPGRRHGVMGISLGAFSAATLYGVDPQFGAGVFILAGASAGEALASSAPDLRDFRQACFEAGLEPGRIPGLFSFLDPGGAADPGRCPGALLINGLFDDVVSYDNARRLGEAFGGANQIWLPAGHHGAFFFLGEVLDKVAEHLRRNLSP